MYLRDTQRIDLPPPGKLTCWSTSEWAGGRLWYAVDSNRKIHTSGDLSYVATVVNKHNLKVERLSEK